MDDTPSVVVFDVNETLSDMSPLADRFTEVGAPAQLAQLWFATVLRDGFALTAAGGTERFATLGGAVLRSLFEQVPLEGDPEAAVNHVLAGFADLAVHPDVPGGVRALREAGLRLVTLSNGSTEVADRLLTTANLRGDFEMLLSVEGAGIWKPAPGAYEYAARACDTDLASMLLVAVHPWDIDGAARAGMSTAWINRTGAAYPGHFTAPRHTVPALTDLATRLVG